VDEARDIVLVHDVGGDVLDGDAHVFVAIHGSIEVRSE
jgi:hypothetical protein